MDYTKKNLFILLFSLYVLEFAKAANPGFDIKVGKSWVIDSISFTQFDGVIDNASKLKINNWYIEIPYDKSVNDLHGTWGCEIEVKDDKIVITGGDINGVIKVKTTAVFGFIVSNPDTNYDAEKAILYFSNKEIPNHTEPDDSEDDIAEAIEILTNCGAIEYAHNLALESVDQAKEVLEILPDSSSKQVLVDIADFVLERNS